MSFIKSLGMRQPFTLKPDQCEFGGKGEKQRSTYSWEGMLRSCLGLALFQVICPIKVWTLVSCV